MNAVTFKIVSGAAKNSFFYSKVGNALIAVENAVYNAAGLLCDEYDGGLWEFAELESGGFFMFPKTEGGFDCSAPNYAQETVGAQAFGITCTLYALSHVSIKWQKSSLSQRLAEAYHALLDYARTREDWPKIAALID